MRVRVKVKVMVKMKEYGFKVKSYLGEDGGNEGMSVTFIGLGGF